MKSPLYLSYFIDESTPIYGGVEGEIQIHSERAIARGDNSNNSKFEFPAHIGTHIDFPFHFSSVGKKSHEYQPSFWLFSKIGFINCEIQDVVNEIEKISVDIEILILKTGFGSNRGKMIYWAEQPVIPSSYASLFKMKFPNLRVFGFDLISLTSKLDREEGKRAHVEFLLNNDILILEDMDLQELNSTPEKLVIAPLQMRSADGVPCTVIAY